MVHAGLGYLAAADATAMAADTQARCLQMLEQATAMGTAARASILAAFTSAQGYSADADYSPKAWLINRTRITKGAAAAYTAWVRRAAAHPEVAAALAAGELSESFARTICPWTGKLPAGLPGGRGRDPGHRGPGRDGRAGPGRAGRGDLRPVPARGPGQGPGSGVRGPVRQAGDHVRRRRGPGRGPDPGVRRGGGRGAGRAVRPGRARRTPAARPSGTTTRCRRRCSGWSPPGCCPSGPGSRSKPGSHISLADLMVLDGSSALLEEWTSRVRAQWAAHRAEASAGGSDGGAWLDGDAAAAMACDAAMAPFVTGEVNPAALEDLVRLCVQLDRLRHHHRRGRDDTGTGGGSAGGGTGSDGQGTAAPDTTRAWEALEQAIIGKAVDLSPAPAGWRRSCAAGSSAPGWAGRACRWTSATPRPSRPGSATRSSCATSTASGPAGATSPPRRARSTTSSTRPTAARPASGIVFYCAGSTTRS